MSDTTWSTLLHRGLYLLCLAILLSDIPISIGSQVTEEANEAPLPAKRQKRLAAR